MALALHLVLAHLELDVRSHLARLELLFAAADVLEALPGQLLVLGYALLAVLDPASGLGECLRTCVVALLLGQLPLALGQKLLLAAQAVAAEGRKALALA